MFGSGSTSRSSRWSSTSSVMTSSSFRPDGQGPARGYQLRLQVAVHQVDFLLTAKALADVLRPDFADSVDCLQLAIGGGQQFLQAPKLVHDLLDHLPGQARDAFQDPEASGRDGVIKRV